MVEPRRVEWRQISAGASVWAPLGRFGWRPAIVMSLGKNRKDNTVVYLSFLTGRRGQGKRYVRELYWRKSLLNGADKPKQIETV